MKFLTTQRQLLFILLGCFALALGMASCGGGGGGGSDQPPPAVPTMVAIQGATHAGTPALPLALAECRFEALQDGQQLAAAFANPLGRLTLQVSPGVQGFARCSPSALPRLVLSAFVSTVGQEAGSVLRNENITPATTVIADHIEATAPADPQARKDELLNDLDMGEPNITVLVEAATLLYQEMLRAEIDSTADFSGAGEGESADGGGGGADGGGAGGEAGDGGEFSPLPGAVCEFSLDLDGKVHANTVLADLYADGRIDRLDLQAIANPVNAALIATGPRRIVQAFAALFPNGLGQPLLVVADGSNSSTPGAYFIPYPAGVPGVIRCRPADQDTLVLTTCVPARLADEILDGQDVTPVSTVVCGITTEVQQAQVNADRDATQDTLFRQLEPLRIFLSEDRNGNGIQDSDEIDKNGDGEFVTIVEIESDVPLTDDNRKLALLASMSTTIFDTMRIEVDSLPIDATFAQARNEFFTEGRFSEPLAVLETGVENTLDDAVNQAVLGTTDVVSAATTGSLRGTVMDESGQAVAGVQVVIFQAGAEVDVVGNPALTDADGVFRIDDIPVGETTVVAFFGEFEVLRVTTNVVAIVTIDLEIMPTPEIQVSPSSLVFGDVEVGSNQMLPVTLTNTGVADLTVDDLQVDDPAGGSFMLGNRPTLPVIISPGSSVEVEVIYQPQAVGSALGTLRVSSDASNTPEASLALIGTAVPQPVPQIQVSPLALSLGGVELGTDQTQSVSIRNTGTAELSITGLQITASAGGAFALRNPPNVPIDVTPGAEVTVRIRYRPQVVGSVTGALRVFSNAEAMPQVTVALSGLGVPQPVSQIEVSRSSIPFGTVQVGGPGGNAVTVTQAVQIRNTGSATLRLTALGVESSVGTEFTLGAAPALPADLTPQAAVNVQVQYRPETIGTVTGALYIRSNADNISDVTVALNGTGVQAPVRQISASTSALAFGEMQVGSSRMLEVSLTNTGTAGLTILSAAVFGNAAFTLQPADAAFTLQQAMTFPVMVSPNASVALHVRYQPNAEGSVTGILEIESDAANTPNLIVALSGTGVPMPMALIDVNPLDIAFAEVEVGALVTVPVTITNSGTADLRVTDLVLTTSTGTDFSLASAPSLPATVQPNDALMLDVQYKPMAVGTATGTLRIENNSLETPAVIVALSGTGVVSATPQIVVAPAALDFGEVQLGESKRLSVTIRNSGTGDLLVNSLVLEALPTSDLILSQTPTVPATVVPGGTVTAEVEYLPTQEGEVTGSLRIGSNAANAAEVTVLVSGAGVVVPAPQIAAAPAALAFGEVQVNDTQVLTVTLSNTGTGNLEITELVLDATPTSGFVLSAVPTTPVNVVPGGAVTVDVAYTPPAEGPVAGTLRVLSNAVNAAELPIPLSGTGVPLPMPQLVVAPVALSFGEVQVGQSGASTVTISNPGTGPLEISAFMLDALAGLGFALSGVPDVPATVASGETLEIGVTYTPTAEGTVTGVVRLLSNAVNAPEVVVPLQGMGVSVPVAQISVQPAALSFGEVQVGSSVPLPLTVQNIGSAPLNITALTLEAEASSGFALTNAPVGAVTVLPGELFNVEVSYTPLAAGTVTGTVRVQSDAVNATEVIVPLQGTGAVILEPQIAVTPAVVAFGGVELGQTQTINVQVLNSGTDVLDLTGIVLESAPESGFTLIGAPALPALLEPSASFSIGVVYAPISAGPLNGQIRIVSNAVNATQVLVPVSGTGILVEGPGILVLPVALDFSAVALGQNLTLSVEVRNVGDANLEWISVQIEPTIDAAFTLDNVPAPVAPGDTVFVDVTYQPTELGPAIGSLQLLSNAVNAPNVSVSLSGTGRPEPETN